MRRITILFMLAWMVAIFVVYYSLKAFEIIDFYFR